MLSREVALRIREAVAAGGSALEEILPESSLHTVRNPYAHIWRHIKKEMGKTYLECVDEDEERILELVRYCVNNPY